jgi:hypothetical protein
MPVQIGGSYRYILTRNQVLDGYENARSLFLEYRDEPAKVALNRLLESNASEPVKNKARLLVSSMDVPDFGSLKDGYSYRQVMQDPVLYRDCYVIWKGMATNADLLDDRTAFDFLVGYDTRRTLEGIVKVEFDFAVSINMERPLQILGKVVPVSGPGGEDVRLEGIALNQAAALGDGKP